MDLLVFYSAGDKPCLTYYINNESAGYKIEFPFSYIKSITLEHGQNDEQNARPAGLVVELNRPPNFFMDSPDSGGFYQCGDFTEDQQASKIMIHHLGGDPRVLSGQLAKLTVTEAFQNRHNPYIDTSAVAVSAPVSPVGHRPASQPNAMSHPQMNHFPEHGFGMSLHPSVPRGHKRTRSRSVPAMTDLSFFRQQPMPTFHVQHPSTTINEPSIYAPVAQYPNNLAANHNLSIDTTQGFGMDFKDFKQYPMSAATTYSPSDYASPGPFNTGPPMDAMHSAPFNPSYPLPYLSPMPEHPHGIQPSVSPLSIMSHADPIIADQSPPLSNMHRSASADFLSMPHDHHSNMSDDGLMLSEMYSKQSITLPIRSGTIDESQLDMQLSEDPCGNGLDMQNFLSFDTIDPSNLSNDNGM